MSLPRTRAWMLLAALAATTPSRAQSQEPLISSQGSNLSRMQAQAKDAQQFAGNEDVKPIVGRWSAAAASFKTTTEDLDHLELNTTWSGRFYGIVKQSGQILFKGDNGCIISGLATPFSANRQWAFNGKMEGCQNQQLSQRVFGNLRLNEGTLSLDASGAPFSMAQPSVALRVSATMRRY